MRTLTAFSRGLSAWMALKVRRAAKLPIRFQKYHVAPRLGTDRVRHRLLMGVELGRHSITATGGGWLD
jgi:hypothetical protein